MCRSSWTLRAKSRGKKFGLQLRSKAWQRRVSAMGRAAIVKQAMERAQANRMHIEWALRQSGFRKGEPISYRAAAQRLNERNIDQGGLFTDPHFTPRINAQIDRARSCESLIAKRPA